ncbi:MAG: phosphoenolpyruvate--protein phosphotransferase [Ruminiclostridium sp.]|nr:phosphoenolpyruvate--protein phosphotransferase [Ruminiclostridium sp.]
MKKYMMKTARGGTAAGTVYRIRENCGCRNRRPESPEYETGLLKKAAEQLRLELSDSANRATGESRSILEAEIMMLTDPSFLSTACEMVKNGDMTAEQAIIQTGIVMKERFSGVSDRYMLSRTDDITGLVENILRMIRGEHREKLEKPSLIAAIQLSPACISRLDLGMIQGIVTEKGSPVSHVSILAGDCGIPYIYGSAEAVAAINNGDRIIIDDGTLIVDPDDETYSAALEKMSRSARREAPPTEAPECSRTPVFANAGSLNDLRAAVRQGADGIGLFRTEFMFLDREDEPPEEEQYGIYREAASIMGDRKTVIRTMDIGSDKRTAWLQLPDEKNPALGFRGIRVSLDHEHIFRKQLRAIMRAAVHGNFRILLPVITSVWEVNEALRIINDCERELTESGIPCKKPGVGVMIETPAAAMIAPELAEIVDFFSIGTNDLTQYTLAIDHEEESLDRHYDPCHEAVFRMISLVCRAAHKQGITVSVCGELAGSEAAIPRLIRSGVDELSVSSSKIGRTRTNAAAAEKELITACIGTDIASPADGRLVLMEDIPDKTFAAGILGRCFGIVPSNGTVYSPITGTVTMIAESKHSFSVENEEESILVHVGIDTVKLGGRGFEFRVAKGDPVEAGQPVMDADLDFIKKAGLSTMMIVVRCS